MILRRFSPYFTHLKRPVFRVSEIQGKIVNWGLSEIVKWLSHKAYKSMDATGLEPVTPTMST